MRNAEFLPLQVGATVQRRDKKGKVLLMKQREFPFLVASDVTHYREQTFILYIRRYQWPLLDLKQTSVSTVLPHVLQFQKLANCTYKIA